MPRNPNSRRVQIYLRMDVPRERAFIEAFESHPRSQEWAREVLRRGMEAMPEDESDRPRSISAAREATPRNARPARQPAMSATGPEGQSASYADRAGDPRGAAEATEEADEPGRQPDGERTGSGRRDEERQAHRMAHRVAEPRRDAGRSGADVGAVPDGRRSFDYAEGDSQLTDRSPARRPALEAPGELAREESGRRAPASLRRPVLDGLM